MEKYERNLARRFSPQRQKALLALAAEPNKLAEMSVADYVDLYVPEFA
jgi:hypothetical protein